jgi:hypothetical protein
MRDAPADAAEQVRKSLPHEAQVLKMAWDNGKR